MNRAGASLRFAALLAFLAVVPGILAIVANPLKPPETARPAVLWILLRGTSAPLDLAVYVVGLAAWTLWGYLAATTALRIAIGVYQIRSGVLPRARAISDTLTLPIVRRSVDGIVGALLIAQTVRPVAVHAMPAPVTVAAVTEPLRRDAAQPQSAESLASVPYWVQSGDSLGLIAERVYGDAEQWRRIFDANVGRKQRDGGALTNEAVVRPGWRLELPLPAQRLTVEDGTLAYTVRKGDCLSTIAARLLGSAQRWPELVELNRDRELAPGQRLSNPDLIRPGWKLLLPSSTGVGVPRQPVPLPPPVRVAPSLTATAAPTITPVVVAPTPVATVGVEPTAASNPEPTVTAGPASADGSPNPWQIPGAAVAAAALVATGVLARRRWVNARRVLHDDPDPADLPHDFGGVARQLANGFVASDALRFVRQRARGVETDKVALTATRLVRVLSGIDIGPVSLMAATETVRDVCFTLSTDAVTQQRIVEACGTETFEEQMGCIVRPRRTLWGDLELELEHLRATEMVSIGTQARHGLWVPVGLSPDGRRYDINLASAGHVLVAGNSTDAAALVGTLALSAAGTLSPDELQIVLVRGESLAPELDQLPHLRTGPVHAGRTEEVGAALSRLEDELVQRMSSRGSTGADQRRVLLVVEDVGGLGEHASTLASLMAQGHIHGVHVLAGVGSSPDGISQQFVRAFSARIVLHLSDEQASALLLGRPGAETLQGGGDAFVRVGVREPVRLRAFRVEPDELQECVALMRHGAGAVDTATTVFNPVQIGNRNGQASAHDGELSVITESRERPDVSPISRPSVSVPVEEAEASQHPGQPAPAPVENRDVLDAHVGPAGFGEREPDPPTKPLEIRCFGSFTALRDGRPVTEWERPDVRAILGFLAIRAPRAVHRDQVIDAIWPDKDAESGKKFLFRRVHSLRKALNEDSDAPFLYFRFDQYRLDPDRVWVDVAAFEERIQRARKAPDEVAEPLLAEAIELYRGELFADGCPDWAIERQEECRANMLQALNRAAACAARRGDYPTAVERYRRALALEPINEEIATNLARALHNLRDRAGIIRLQSSLVEVLRRELDDPDAELQPETQEIFDEILADLQASAARLRPADVARR